MSLYTRTMSAQDNVEQEQPAAGEVTQVKLTKTGKIDKRSTPEYKAACAARLRAGQARKNEYLKAGKELLNRKIPVPDSSSDDEPEQRAPINSADFALWLEFERFRLAKSLGVLPAANAQPVVSTTQVSENKPAVVEKPVETHTHTPAPTTAIDMTPSKPIPIPARPATTSRRIARF